MKALYFDQHGELDVIQYGDVPEPETGPGQIKMKVRATALNYLDVWVRRGWPGLKLEMPHWCGADMAGEIVELGKGVSGWQVGQRVVADPGINSFEDEFTGRGEDSVSPGYHVLGEHRRGGAAEYMVLPANGVAASGSSMARRLVTPSPPRSPPLTIQPRQRRTRIRHSFCSTSRRSPRVSNSISWGSFQAPLWRT